MRELKNEELFNFIGRWSRQENGGGYSKAIHQSEGKTNYRLLDWELSKKWANRKNRRGLCEGLDWSCKRTCQGLPTFDATSTGITLKGQDIYHITATFVGTGTVAGALTVQMYDNGDIVTGATSTETITTANTEQRTLVIDYYVKVDSACVLGNWAVSPKTLTFRNDGVGATFSNVVVNIEKVV